MDRTKKRIKRSLRKKEPINLGIFQQEPANLKLELISGELADKLYQQLVPSENPKIRSNQSAAVTSVKSKSEKNWGKSSTGSKTIGAGTITSTGSDTFKGFEGLSDLKAITMSKGTLKNQQGMAAGSRVQEMKIDRLLG